MMGPRAPLLMGAVMYGFYSAIADRNARIQAIEMTMAYKRLKCETPLFAPPAISRRTELSAFSCDVRASAEWSGAMLSRLERGLLEGRDRLDPPNRARAPPRPTRSQPR